MPVGSPREQKSARRPVAPLVKSRRAKIIAFGWYGGKFSHLDWLLPLLPEAHHYCEPFGGSAAVLINRAPAPVETYNDLDGEVVNFFRILRTKKDELVEAIGLTPFSREEFAQALQVSAEDNTDLERARQFFVRARQARTGLAQTATLGRWANWKRVRIPSSAGPYLSVFRRSVQFTAETGSGLRDREGYEALLRVLEYAESATPVESRHLMDFLVFKLIELREASVVPIARPGRISLAQFGDIVDGLLDTPSGGRFPLILVVTTFKTLNETFGLNWIIDFQGINVADSASGAGGDITVRAAGQIILAAEVTEREVDRSRVVTTFQSKILPDGIQDYLFFIRPAAVRDEARQQAVRYFSQGHEASFVDIKNWILMLLATVGPRGRDRMVGLIIEMLEAANVPKHMRVAWNRQIEALTA